MRAVYQLKSNTSCLIAKLLGVSKDLRLYDFHHHKFKKEKNNNSKKICSKVLPILQKNIKNAVEEASIKLAKWEKQFFVEKNMIPTINDITRGTEKTAYDKIKYGKRLLLMWNL